MDLESRVELIMQVGEEVVTPEELKALLQTKSQPVAYDGFEPSGQLHIAQGIFRAINVNKMLNAGVHFKFWVADWFGWMNNKMGGDLEKIKKVGEYQIEVWKACGMQTDRIEFLWASDVMNDREYWKRVINIARNNTVKRILRCSQIMGRSESEELSAAQIFYPCMQCSDIFQLKADITQLGMDQRKVNMLAREVGPKLGYWKPIVVSSRMIMGLKQPRTDLTDPVERAIAMKMSKSIPDSAIFMNDSEEDIKRKIANAYCPIKQVEENPILEYAKFLVFEKFGKLSIERPAKFGGNVEYLGYADLEKDYVEGKLHPQDLKSAMAESINAMIAPVREHFEKNLKAKKLLEEVKGFKTTR